MKRLSVLVLAALAFAALGADNRTTLERIGNSANVANGSWDLNKYNKTTFTEKAAVWRMTNQRPSNKYCKYGTTTTAKNIFTQLKSDREDNVASAIGQLYSRHQIRFMVHRFNTEGESESCSHYYYEIYTVDGYRLGLYYDFTD